MKQANQKGFANIILVVVIVIIAGAVGYFMVVKKLGPIAGQTPTPTPTQTKALAPTPKDETANWKSFRQETNLYEVKYPSTWDISSGAGDSVGADSFGFKTTTGGIDQVVSITYFTSNYGEVQPRQIIEEQTILLDGTKAVRQTVIDSEGNKIIRIRTTEKHGALNFRIDLHKLNYLSTFDAMLQTFRFVK